MTHKLFAYGTLMDSTTQRIHLGRELRGDLAQVHGYLVGSVFTNIRVCRTLVPEPKGCAYGFVYDNLSDQDLATLDTYQGQLYTRTHIKTAKGEECWVYVAKPNT